MITDADLAAELRETLARAIFPSLQQKERIKDLLARWDAQQRRGDPGAAIVRQWNCDREYFLKTLDQLDEAGIYQMAAAAVAHCTARVPWAPVSIDQMLAAWQAAAQQCAIEGGNQGQYHGSSTTR